MPIQRRTITSHEAPKDSAASRLGIFGEPPGQLLRLHGQLALAARRRVSNLWTQRRALHLALAGCGSARPNIRRKQFSVKIGTIWEDSPISIDKWLIAAWMLANCKNGISSYELAAAIGVTQRSAWFVMHRIREAIKNRSIFKIGRPEGGPVEVDETWIGLESPSTCTKNAACATSRAVGHHGDETVVMGMLDREQREIRAKVVRRNVKRETLQAEVLSNVRYGTKVLGPPRSRRLRQTALAVRP